MWLPGVVLRVLHETDDHYGVLQVLDPRSYEKRDSIRLGDAWRVDVLDRDTWLVWCDENESNYGGLYVVDGQGPGRMGLVRNPAGMRPHRHRDLLLVFAWEDDSGYGGVAVFDLERREKVAFHRCGDPVAVTRERGRLVVRCDENESNYGGDLIIDGLSGRKINFLRR